MATKTKQSVAKAPAVVSVITSAQIRQMGYRSVAEALDSLPGLAVNTDHVYDNVGVRGISGGLRGGSRHLKVLLNGHPIAFRTDAQNFLGPELIPMTAIERIEVVRGPLSALYGLNAFLGVVNIVTKQAETGSLTGSERLAQVSVGSIRKGVTHQEELLVAEKLAGVRFTVAAHYGREDRSGLSLPSSSPNFADYPPGATVNDLSRPISVFASAAREWEKAGAFELQGAFQQLDSVGAFVDYGALTRDTRVNLLNWHVRLRHAISAGIVKINSYISYSGGGPGSRDQIRPVLDGQPLGYLVKRDFGFAALDVGVEASTALLNDKLNLLLGAEYSYDSERLRQNAFQSVASGDSVLGTDLGRAAFADVGVYAQALYEVLPWLSLSGNFRVDQHNLFGTNLNYRAGVVFSPLPSLSIKLLSGSSYRAPTPEQLYGLPISPGDAVGSLVSSPPRSLRPQTALNHELVFGYSIQGFDVTVSGYLNDISNRIEYLFSEGLLQPSNLANSRTLGTELTFSKLIYSNPAILTSSFHGSFAYSNTTTSLNLRTLTPREAEILQAPDLYPAFMGKALLSVEVPKAYLAAAVQFIAYSGRYDSTINQTIGRPFVGSPLHVLPPSYTLNLTLSSANVRIIGKLETVIQVQLRDLLNTQAPDPGFSGINVPALGRRFFVSVTQYF